MSQPSTEEVAYHPRATGEQRFARLLGEASPKPQQGKHEDLDGLLGARQVSFQKGPP